MLIQVDRVAKAENLTLSDDGRTALTRLANGDMRRALNIMQSTAMAFSDAAQVTLPRMLPAPFAENGRFCFHFVRLLSVRDTNSHGLVCSCR